MKPPLPHVRHGFGTVRPYIFGYRDAVDFVTGVFDAEIVEDLPGPHGTHAEIRIGDSLLVLEAADPPPAGGIPSSIYVYCADVDEAYRRALERGAVSVAPPADRPYQERATAFRDRYGNIWYVATYRP